MGIIPIACNRGLGIQHPGTRCNRYHIAKTIGYGRIHLDYLKCEFFGKCFWLRILPSLRQTGRCSYSKTNTCTTKGRGNKKTSGYKEIFRL